MTISTWLLFCLTETVLCCTPGPAVLLVISLSLSRGAGAGFRASLGILAANTVYFALSATSLGAVLVASWQLFFVIKWIGAGYLIWLGIHMLLFPSAARSNAAAPNGTAPRTPRADAFAYGFMTQAANPKALIFFTALLPQFLNPEAAVPVQVAILGGSSVLIELVVLALYVVASDRARSFARHPSFAGPLERMGGLFLLAAGARLAAIRRG